MPYYTRDDEAVDDFDEYDPTPYGGGFDLFLTYGRPIPPSEETCYPHSAGNDDDIDYERPQFESYAEPSAYGDDALQAEYSSYSRPKPHSYGAPPPSVEQEYGSGGYESARPQPAYGFQPSGSEYGSEGYRRKPEYEEQEYGSGGYRRKQESESYGSEEYGSGGYGQRQESDSYGSGVYGRRQESDSYGSGGYGRRQEEGDSEGYRRPPNAPFYIVDLGQMVVQMAKFRKHLPGVAPYYAIKCNNSECLIAMIAALGGSFDCASLPEIKAVLDPGYAHVQASGSEEGQRGGNIIYANPAKPPFHMQNAERLGVKRITFDNEMELEKVQRYMPSAEAVLRIRTNGPGQAPGPEP